MSLDKEKVAPEAPKASATEKVKDATKQNFLDLDSNKEFFDKMKNMYGDTETSFVKGIRGSDDYGTKCKTMSDSEVLEFAKAEAGLKEYHSKIIQKKTPKLEAPQVPKEKPAEKAPEPAAEKPAAEKPVPVTKPESTDKPKEDNKPAEKATEPEKKPEKKPEEKKEKKKNFLSKLFTKKEKGKKSDALSKVGSAITYLPKQAWKATKAVGNATRKGIKAIPHQTWNLVSYAPRVARSSIKYIGFDWINHGLNKAGLKKNRDNYASKWKREQAAKKK